jgi:hypothetical protein
MPRKRSCPKREQFTDEEWDRFGKLCEVLKQAKQTLLAKKGPVTP